MISRFAVFTGTCQLWLIDACRGFATAAVVVAFLAACGGSDSGDASQGAVLNLPQLAPDNDADITVLMQIEVPARIGELQNVDLEYTIELKGGGIISRLNPGASFSVPFSATGSSRYYYRIEIRALQSGLLIAIREGSKWLDTSQTLLVSSSHFRTSGTQFDFDGDGLSNLQELEEQHNPAVPQSTRIAFSFTVADWVQALNDAGFIRFETYVDTIGNNDGKFLVSFNAASHQYEATGFGLAVGGQPREIGILIRVAKVPYPFPFHPDGLTLGLASRPMTLQNGVNVARFEWHDFITDSDLDRDGTTNLEEIRRGTNPVTGSPEYTIPVVAGGSAPLIDGNLQESAWYSLQPVSAGGNALSLGATIQGGAVASGNPFDRFFTAVHDFSNLYIGVQIKDDTIIVDSAEQRWHDDSIEIYLDGDNSRLNRYDGANDLALNFRFANAGAQVVEVAPGRGSVAVPASMRYAMTHDFFSGATQLEIALPLSELNIDISAGIGLDIQYNDDDNGGDRDRKYGWRGPDGEDNAWTNPTWFGEIEFSH